MEDRMRIARISFIVLLAAAACAGGLFAEGSASESSDATLPLIERSVTTGFFGVKGSYFDQDGMQLDGSTLVTFLQTNNDDVNAKRVQDAMSKVGTGKVLYWVGLLAICVSPLTVDYGSTAETGEMPSMVPFIITIGGGSVAAFGGIAMVKNGNDTIDSAVISYNGKVKKGTLSFAPQIRDDHLALALAIRY
jgi:hypothetical protein